MVSSKPQGCLVSGSQEFLREFIIHKAHPQEELVLMAIYIRVPRENNRILTGGEGDHPQKGWEDVWKDV